MMRVAVIGAGISGLACVHELERHGIEPAVFEQKHRSGELFDHCAATLELFTRPYDALDYLQSKYNLHLRPISKIKRIIMNVPTKTVPVKGDNLGYFFLRGHDPVSIETQLFESIRSKVNFNFRADYAELARQFDYVVVANGQYDISRTLGIWSNTYETYLIGAIVIGDFDLNTLVMWLNTRYAKSAYAYLAPLEKNRAFLALVVPYSTPEQAREYWKLFWEIEKHPWEIVYEVMVQHIAGFVYPHQVGNILLVGVAGGFLDPFLGFGVLASLQSGALAGRAVATGKKYEDLLRQLKEDMKHSLAFRQLLKGVDNSDLNRLVSLIGKPGIKQFIYNTNIDFARWGTELIGRVEKFFN
ncbi:Dehydrogenase (flavoprotein)-like protein [Desulfofarcimen acetoxidans DSM 771]|uniref:Dehydrogenase (Flavoprotein)-like protein n=1 Tax=Desulfofarcimen acetoxidans (strain ATCC 49208 / DSM 771 / KCTC 5769 / VKM B-1644 / 5575) TaxID=485916 RepID=C8W2M0_DESAS|nr:NAD(P)/FAD-dependent oxidoreductase [Desulfofarcimen acetoxidans]ACV63704.1 Dehydrogenase (flavoprotein)-like protein [Desulfofarcimen acetoxidans DSM 771]